MTVTKIEAVTKTRYKVYVDEQFAFVLYKGELSRFHLEAGSPVEEEMYHKIRKEIVLKRAKLRALHLLNDMSRTEVQLRQKLKTGGYTEDIVDEALAYVKSFGYINDAAYARNFIETRKDKKSRKEIYAQLCQKGLDRDEIDRAFEECYEGNDAAQAITAILEKKKYDPETADATEKRRILGYLTRKGFGYEDIRKVLQVYEWNA